MNLCIKLFAISTISFLFACKQENPGQLPKLEQVAFQFQNGTELPEFISINSSENGEYIAHIKPAYDQLQTIEIPKKLQAADYMISYVFNTEMTYLYKRANVLTFNDVRKDLIETKAFRFPPYDYKKLTLTSWRDIEFFANGNAGNYYNKIEDSRKEAYIELGTQTDQSIGKIVIVKLDGETDFRFLILENPLQFQADTLDIETFAKTSRIQRINISDRLRNARIQIFSQFPNQAKKELVFDSYKNPLATEDYIDFPYVEGDFTYSVYIDYMEKNGAIGYYVTDEIPETIEIPNLNVSINNQQFSAFSPKISGADMATHTIESEQYFWHVFDHSKNEFRVIKPEFPEEILARFPDLTQEGEWKSSNLIRFLPGNELDYSDFVLPHRHLGAFYRVALRSGFDLYKSGRIQLEMRGF